MICYDAVVNQLLLGGCIVAAYLKFGFLSWSWLAQLVFAVVGFCFLLFISVFFSIRAKGMYAEEVGTCPIGSDMAFLHALYYSSVPLILVSVHFLFKLKRQNGAF